VRDQAARTRLVIAAGSFQNANGNAAADQIAYFNGVSLRPVGSNGAGNGPLAGQATALGVTGGKGLRLGKLHLRRRRHPGHVGGRLRAASARRVDRRQRHGPLRGQQRVQLDRRRRGTPRQGEAGQLGVLVRQDPERRSRGAASFDIKGTGGAHGITARYFRGRTNITTKVRAGTYGTASVAPGARVVLRVVVRAASSSAAQATFLTSARYTTGTPPDAVRFVTEATGEARSGDAESVAERAADMVDFAHAPDPGVAGDGRDRAGRVGTAGDAMTQRGARATSSSAPVVRAVRRRRRRVRQRGPVQCTADARPPPLRDGGLVRVHAAR
jgi:hypothetical protein